MTKTEALAVIDLFMAGDGTGSLSAAVRIARAALAREVAADARAPIRMLAQPLTASQELALNRAKALIEAYQMAAPVVRCVGDDGAGCGEPATHADVGETGVNYGPCCGAPGCCVFTDGGGTKGWTRAPPDPLAQSAALSPFNAPPAGCTVCGGSGESDVAPACVACAGAGTREAQERIGGVALLPSGCRGHPCRSVTLSSANAFCPSCDPEDVTP